MMIDSQVSIPGPLRFPYLGHVLTCSGGGATMEGANGKIHGFGD